MRFACKKAGEYPDGASGLYDNIINSREPTLIITHRSTPWTRGFTPTLLRTLGDKDAPIKNMVIVRHLREIPLKTVPICG